MNNDDKPLWMQIAEQYVGTQEFKGVRHNPLIVNMWKLIRRSGIKDDETPWCSAFVGGCLEEAGIVSSRHEGAISYAKWGKPCDMRYGAICVRPRPGGNHVFFAVALDQRKGYVIGLGGNQNDSVTFATFPIAGISHWRWPSAVPLGIALPHSNSSMILLNQRMN